jgi:tetratricopeptide (TPR) repeat protein
LILLKTIVGTSLIKRFKKKRDISLIDKAETLLQEDIHISESPFLKAKRLNNIGLCELLKKHYANGFKYFSKAFEIYKEDRNLNLIGLLRNISEVYREWEMF